jgi:hypothetical protein
MKDCFGEKKHRKEKARNKISINLLFNIEVFGSFVIFVHATGSRF